MSLYLIIMGVQGAGKGTQAAWIAENFGIPHVSTGDLFRAMKTREDDLARKVQAILKSGGLVSDEITNEVLQDRLEQPDAANGVILDGYPRNPAQAQWLEDYLTRQGAQLDAALLLELDYYTAFKRAFGRVKSAETGETYNIFFNNDGLDVQIIEDPQGLFPPRYEVILKATGEKLQRRSDDNAPSVMKRIDIFTETTSPLIDHYQSKGVLVRIDADQSIEQVSEDVRGAIERVRE